MLTRISNIFLKQFSVRKTNHFVFIYFLPESYLIGVSGLICTCFNVFWVLDPLDGTKTTAHTCVFTHTGQ
jgi:hypothetical protein